MTTAVSTTPHSALSPDPSTFAGAVCRSGPETAEQRDFAAFMANLPVSLSPALIMAMLQRRMSGLDSQIQADVSAMEDQQAKLTGLQRDSEILLAIKGACPADGKISGVTLVVYDGQTKSAADWLHEVDPSITLLPPDADHHVFDYYTTAKLDVGLKSLESEIKRVNQGTELKMMDLQSLMQQRSSEISLATNMLKAVQDGTDAIVRNIG